MFRSLFIFLILGAGLMACSSVSKISIKGESLKVDEQYKKSSRVDSMIQPYRIELQKEMDVKIAFATGDFLVERPCGSLNNWVADALMYYLTKNNQQEAPTFCLFNTGGIRSTINQGDVTVGDIFKVMPFDNLLAWVKMPISSIPLIESHLKVTGGEPISGAYLDHGKLIIKGMNSQSTYFWIITSDYLMNGGDKMSFFEQKISSKMTDSLMRDALLSVAKEQSVLVMDTNNRITF